MAFTIDRRKGIGGSDVAALCGLNKRKSAYHLFLEKRGVLPPDMDVEENERIRWGRVLEKPIADEFARKTGRRIERVRRTLRHPTFRFMLANVDRKQQDPARADRRGVVECKNHDARFRRDWVTGGVPDTHYMQLQHYLLVTGLDYGSFAVLFGGNEHLYFDVERDDTLIANMIDLERDFWRRVELNEPPEMSFDRAGAELVAALYKEAATGSSITMDAPEAQAKVARLLSLKEAIKKREKIQEELETWIKFQMKDAARAVVPGIGYIDWANGTRKSVNLDEFRKAHPDLVAAFTELKPSRRFTVKPVKDYAIEEGDGVQDDAPVYISTNVRQIQLD